jgi:peptide chain release factor 3
VINTNEQIKKRRTFAIISHPDAGKTTLTEKLLLFGNAILQAGAVKSKKNTKQTTSDWMSLERERGISVSSSVMQFPFKNKIINLLDTPGHEDFSEDTYRTLTAVDSALMVIDVAKGVEKRTKKLMEICRMRTTPVMTFINKIDREGREPIELLDEIENTLKIKCAPITWPCGMGKRLKGVYHLRKNKIHLFAASSDGLIKKGELIKGIDNIKLVNLIGEDLITELKEEIELITEASYPFDKQKYLRGELTPVFFGSAINNFGIAELLDDFIEYAPAPSSMKTTTDYVEPTSDFLSGFVFKIQANMDPQHRDRIAFVRICSGAYQRGDKVKLIRCNKEIKINDAITFMASSRDKTDKAYAGDIIGIHNHGAIHIGDTLSQKNGINFIGIPNFAPELFRKVQIKDPLKNKALQKGLQQLCEEGATQLFKPLSSNELIVGAVGILQFEVTAARLQDEYKVKCVFEPTNTTQARWINCSDEKILKKFTENYNHNLSFDNSKQLVYLAPSMVNLNLAIDKNPDIIFSATREQKF